ncbi:hypothetical protein UVI_02021000 [Ustilaginoidea virens]|uniref:DNA polymerase II large subunit-like protein n=1 Tax=Ustilaginoidea virens TaxID=1159556 RepID=A0A1B5KXQ9_USTVR|nr:hypothetical protein UVI_02021000 [Ustilaginoidea virens]
MASSDCHFYGPEEEKQRLEARVEKFDASAWLRQRNTLLFGCPSRKPSAFIDSNSSKLHNPYAGVGYAWQLTETLEAFLTRLPPATTDRTDDVPWIFICNPYVSSRERQTRDEKGGQLHLVARGAAERLELLADLTQKVTSSGASPTFIARELSSARAQAAADILNLAHAGRVRTGKWMLFHPAVAVNEVWELVARATANNELGVAAKVAPRAPFDDVRSDRLVCIYTADFMDRCDVGRVLKRLRELKLAGSDQRRIYYKPDIYTYIGISSGNPWGLSASIYNSGDFS